MTTDYILGLDLGQVSDPSALAVLERPAGADPEYALRHLQRYPLGTPYPKLVPGVLAVAAQLAVLGDVVLVVDQTGVGRAVVDLFSTAPAAPRVVPVTITAGHAVTVAPDGSLHVPKKELVTALQLLLQHHRLKVARALPDAEVLRRELMTFRVKITAAANETFGAWREGDHDDLVLAAALAAWWAERNPRIGPEAFGVGEPTEMAKLLAELEGTW